MKPRTTSTKSYSYSDGADCDHLNGRKRGTGKGPRAQGGPGGKPKRRGEGTERRKIPRKMYKVKDWGGARRGAKK